MMIVDIPKEQNGQSTYLMEPEDFKRVLDNHKEAKEHGISKYLTAEHMWCVYAIANGWANQKLATILISFMRENDYELFFMYDGKIPRYARFWING